MSVRRLSIYGGYNKCPISSCYPHSTRGKGPRNVRCFARIDNWDNGRRGAGAQLSRRFLQALTRRQTPRSQLTLNESQAEHLSFIVISLETFNSHWREGKSSILKTIPVYSFTALVMAAHSEQHDFLSIFPI